MSFTCFFEHYSCSGRDKCTFCLSKKKCSCIFDRFGGGAYYSPLLGNGGILASGQWLSEKRSLFTSRCSCLREDPLDWPVRRSWEFWHGGRALEMAVTVLAFDCLLQRHARNLTIHCCGDSSSASFCHIYIYIYISLTGSLYFVSDALCGWECLDQ